MRAHNSEGKAEFSRLLCALWMQDCRGEVGIHASPACQLSSTPCIPWWPCLCSGVSASISFCCHCYLYFWALHYCIVFYPRFLMRLELGSGTKIQASCLGLIMMIRIFMVNNNITGQYCESFLCAYLDQSISCILFWGLIGYSPWEVWG